MKAKMEINQSCFLKLKISRMFSESEKCDISGGRVLQAGGPNPARGRGGAGRGSGRPSCICIPLPSCVVKVQTKSLQDKTATDVEKLEERRTCCRGFRRLGNKPKLVPGTDTCAW